MSDATATMSGDGSRAPQRLGSGAGLVLVYASPLAGVSRAFALEGRSVMIGRDPGPGGWVVGADAVSRVHAALDAHADGTFSLRDMGSRNGTFVAGRRIDAPTPLAAGDLVRLGDALFVFVAQDAARHAEVPLEGQAFGGLVGGVSMARVAEAVQAVAASEATVLVTGETGVGKELVARLLHEARAMARGRKGRLAAVNCAAIPESLFESELFGVERGAFTGADRAREGLVRSAEGGTLFLDEVGDMPLALQAKLLRLLENREVLAVGATHAVKVDARVVCATHQDLPRLVREGRFRGDLYARISQRVVQVPPLRARREDLHALTRAALAARGASRVPAVTFGFMLRLAQHDWPFNVRELVSAVQHAADLAAAQASPEGELHAAHLPAGVGAAPAPAMATPATAASAPVVRERRKGPTADELRTRLAEAKGNVAAVARALDREAPQVYRWLRQYKLDPNDFR